jgi:hypothetical protein
MPEDASMYSLRVDIIRRHKVESHQTDLSFIKSMATIGASYSVAIGAGDSHGRIAQATN